MKLGITGAGGRMGRALAQAIGAERGLELAAALDAQGAASIGQEVGGVKVGWDLEAAIGACEALIDFTRPDGSVRHVQACVRHGRAIVIGTTGFSDAQLGAIRDAAGRIPIVMAPNFAVGVNVLFKVAEMAARALGADYDVEIIEAHHRHKIDAPSGTALKLGEVIAQALGRELATAARHGRSGDVGERTAAEIGFHAVRGGDIVGEHTALFAGTGERLELTVRSQSRMTYAAGAVRAAKWVRGRPAGLYDMFDVLGMK
jgi:4-hydroxy-tetrahydrodipicolinate reductase